jgi:hypothetical protein
MVLTVRIRMARKTMSEWRHLAQTHVNIALTPHRSEIIPMDWRAMSRSRSRVPMDWRPSSRSRSRPPPATGIQFDGVLSHPERLAFPSLEHPSDSKPSHMHGLTQTLCRWEVGSPILGIRPSCYASTSQSPMVDTVPRRRPPITRFPSPSFPNMPVTILTQEPFIPVPWDSVLSSYPCRSSFGGLTLICGSPFVSTLLGLYGLARAAAR